MRIKIWDPWDANSEPNSDKHVFIVVIITKIAGYSTWQEVETLNIYTIHRLFCKL